MRKILVNWFNRYFSDEEAVLMLSLLALAVIVILVFDTLLIPVVVAVVVAFLLQGVVNRCVARKIPRAVAVYGVFTLFAGLVILAYIFLVPLVLKQATTLVSETPGMLRQWQQALLLLPEKYPQFITTDELSKVMDYVSAGIADFAESLLKSSVSSFPSLFALLVYSILVPLLVFFMLKDKDALISYLASPLPEQRPVLRKIGAEMNQQMANYVRGKALEILVVGASCYIAFLILGLNYAALLAFLVGLSVIVPYVGAIVVTIPVTMVAYFQWGLEPAFFWLVGSYLLIQILDGNVLVPLLFSEALNLHPVAIILAILMFGGIWGFWGIFFAIPLATLVKAVYNAWPRVDRPPSDDQEIQAE